MQNFAMRGGPITRAVMSPLLSRSNFFSSPSDATSAAEEVDEGDLEPQRVQLVAAAAKAEAARRREGGAEEQPAEHRVEVEVVDVARRLGEEDEGVDASESYFKYGAAALKHIFDDSTTSGALFVFWAPHHGDENAADVLHCAAPTMPPAGHNRRSVHFLKLGKVPQEGSRTELMDCLQFGACTANVLSDAAGC